MIAFLSLSDKAKLSEGYDAAIVAATATAKNAFFMQLSSGNLA